MLHLLRTNRDIRLLFLAQTVSYLGDWFAYVAFVGVVQDLTDSPLLVTLVYVALTLPAFFASGVAGPVADRFDRRTIIRTVSLAQAVCALGLLLAGQRATLALGYLALVAISALGAFVGPASQAGLPNLARTPDELKQASLMFSALWGAMLFIGAAAGGFFAHAFGRNAAFLADAASFVVAAGLVMLIRRPMQLADRSAPVTEQGRGRIAPITDMREALRHARRDPVLIALMASKATFAMGAGIVGLLAVLATKEFGGGDNESGLMIGARGVGVAAGPLLANRIVGRDLSKVLRVCGSAGVIFGVCYLAVAAVPWFWVAVALLLVAHLGGGAQWTLSTYGLQSRSDDDVRGRILAGDFGLTMLIITVSNLVAGVVAAFIGPRATIAAFAVLGVAASALYLSRTAELRRQLAAEEHEASADAGGR